MYFLIKVNIWNVNCALATTFIFDKRKDVLFKVSKFVRPKMSRPEGDSNPQPSDSCWMFRPFDQSRPDIYCPMLLNTCSGGIDIFEVKLTFGILTMCRQRNSFSTHEQMFFWKRQRFLGQKMSLPKGTRIPKLRILAELSNHLSYQLLIHAEINVIPYLLKGPRSHSPIYE